MISIQDYQQLIKDVAQLERQEAEAEGALTEVKKALQAEHGCKDLKEAKALRAKLNKEVDELVCEVEQAYKNYQLKYKDLLCK